MVDFQELFKHLPELHIFRKINKETARVKNQYNMAWNSHCSVKISMTFCKVAWDVKRGGFFERLGTVWLLEELLKATYMDSPWPS